MVLLEIALGIALGILISVLAILPTLLLLFRKYGYVYTKAQLDRIIGKRLDSQRDKVKGDIGERIAPHMKEFIEKYEPSDARFLGGKPVDYIVYKNYSKALVGRDVPIEKVVFVEVKTGKNDRLTEIEEKVKDAIKSGRVDYDTVHLKSIQERFDQVKEGGLN